ncbi:MAG: FixH family protein [Longimicrobiales bacterium]
MHLRLGAPGGGRRLSPGRRVQVQRVPTWLLLLTLCSCVLTGACHRPAAVRGVRIEWTLTPSPPTVGAGLLTLQVRDGAGALVRGAKLRVEGHMSHPGMAPVLATARERGHGVYDAELQFTMRGDWILLVSGVLTSGDTVSHRIDVPNVRSGG